MALTATIVSVDSREEAFSILVVYADGQGKEVTRKTMSFSSGADIPSVQAEIQRVGSVLSGVITSAAAVQGLKGTQIPIV